MPAIGFVTMQDDGSYKGELQMLAAAIPLEIRPVPSKATEKHPDFRVFAGNAEIGSGSKRVGQESGSEYISLSLAALEFGPKRITVNLGPAPNESNKMRFVLLWNPEN